MISRRTPDAALQEQRKAAPGAIPAMRIAQPQRISASAGRARHDYSTRSERTVRWNGSPRSERYCSRSGTS